MPVLDAKSAADLIKPVVQVTSMDTGLQEFVSGVAHHLGLDASKGNALHIARILGQFDIHPYTVQEYPKMATDEDGEPVLQKQKSGKPIPGAFVIFHNKAEEDAFHAGH